MRRIWQMRGVALLLIGGALATFAWGETVELVTYFPSTAQAGDLHLRSLTVGTGLNGEVMGDGEVLIESRLGINAVLGDFGVEDRLYVVGGDDVASQVLFLPGTDTAAAGVPDIRVGIGTATPNAGLDVRGEGALIGRDTLQYPNPFPPIQFFDPVNNMGMEVFWDSDYLSLVLRDRDEVVGGDDKDAIILWGDNSTVGAIGPDNLLFIFRDIALGESEIMRLTPAGNVGIGTTAPLSPLHTFGMWIQPPSGDATATNPLHRASAVFDAVSDGAFGYSSSYTGGLASSIALSYNDQPAARLGFFANATNGNINNSTFYINTDPTQVLSWVSPSFVITDLGDVGIGETNPGAFNPPNGLRKNLVVANDIYVGAANGGAGQWVTQLGGASFITRTYLGNGGSGRRTIVVPGISASRPIRFLLIVKGILGSGAGNIPVFIKSETMPSTEHYINGDASDYRTGDGAIRLENNGFSINRSSNNANRSGITYHVMILAD